MIYSGEDGEGRNKGILNLGEWEISFMIFSIKVGNGWLVKVEWIRGMKYVRSNGR